MSKRLPRAFYDRDTVAVAGDLLGKHLVHLSDGVERIGRIVEVEAYRDPRQSTPTGTRSLWRPRGKYRSNDSSSVAMVNGFRITS